MSNDMHLMLCYVTDILDILIFIGCCYVLSINIKLYTEIIKGKKIDKLNGE